MNSNPVDENGNFTFLDEEDQQFFQTPSQANIEPINLMETQKQILKEIINLGSWDNQKDQRVQSDTYGDDEHDDSAFADEQSQKIAIGAHGDLLQKSLFSFKIIVFDNHVQNLIAPIFKVGNLRDCNVVMHANINSSRDQCPGLAVIYLVEPTDENFKQIAVDCQKGLYDFVFVNFIREASDQDLDNFAIQITKAHAAHKICRVAYEHVGSFQSISQDFFQLFEQKNNFIDLYKNQNEDQITKQISKNLYETFCAMGIAPILKIEDGDFEINQKIAKNLQQLFQKCDPEQKAIFSQKERPLLFLFNRKSDIQGMMYHSWKYLSLIQDVFGIKNNKITYKEDGKSETFELDFEEHKDDILTKNLFIGFHEAGPNVTKGLEEWTREYNKISQGQNQNGGDISSSLNMAIDKLPVMQDKKKKIDMHVKLATKLLTEIKSRQIDKLQDIEDEILTKRSVSGENKQDLINYMGLDIPADAESTFDDKVRILMIMILCFKDLEQLQKFIESVDEKCHNEKQKETMSKVKTMFQKKLNIENEKKKGEQENSANQSQAFGFAKQLTQGLASGISNLITDQNNQQHVFARDVKQTIKNIKGRYTMQNVKFYDMLSGETLNQVDANQSLNHIFAFSFGGGSTHEYESFKTVIEQLDEDPKDRDRNMAGTKIIYGCDYVFQPIEFLQEILKLN